MLQRQNEPEVVAEKPAPAAKPVVVVKKVVKKVTVYRAPVQKASKDKVLVIRGDKETSYEF
jgi:hypothetical protein